MIMRVGYYAKQGRATKAKGAFSAHTFFNLLQTTLALVSSSAKYVYSINVCIFVPIGLSVKCASKTEIFTSGTDALLYSYIIEILERREVGGISLEMRKSSALFIFIHGIVFLS